MSSERDSGCVQVLASRGHLPGVEGIWIFVVADMTVFGLLFALFMVGRHQDPSLYEASRLTLNPDFGGINTLILLTSSWFVVLAVEAVRQNRFQNAPRLLAGAFLCGGSFVVNYAAARVGNPIPTRAARDSVVEERSRLRVDQRV